MNDNSPRIEEFDPTLMADQEGRPILSLVDHMSRARRFRDARRPNLRFWHSGFFDWTATSYYLDVGTDTLKSEIWAYLEHARRWDKKEEKYINFYPNSESVGETIAALKAVCQIDETREPPYWIADELPGELIVFPNGMLDITTDTFHPPNANYFTLSALGFDYQPRRGEPKEWLKFLGQIFQKERVYEAEPRDDDEAYDRLIEEAESVNEAHPQIRALQEIFGCVISGDTSFEKCFLLLGPRRSGKGTIINMMRALLASTAVAGPTLGAFGTQFGLSSLVGKALAIIDDLRIGLKDQSSMVENILKITGRGLFSFDRKYKSYWDGELPVLLFLVSNMMPRLGDDSSALAGRFIILKTLTSFFNRENRKLFKNKLRPEVSDVFHWALEGLRRLRANGCFTEPATSIEARDRMGELGSMVRAFVADWCVLGVGLSVAKANLYESYKRYAEMNKEAADNNAQFFTSLYAATEGKVTPYSPRDENGKQVQSVLGIALKDGAGDGLSF